MALNRNAKLAVGLGVVVVALVVVFLLRGKGDVDSDVVLRDNPDCVVAVKDPEVRQRKNGLITWHVRNNCRNRNELVTLGNFRMTEASNARDCLAATEGTVVWPFQQREDLGFRQSRGTIPLRVRNEATTGRPYYYDICTGDNAQRKSDPRLVIDP